jgi:serine/threonine-protein kinase
MKPVSGQPPSADPALHSSQAVPAFDWSGRRFGDFNVLRRLGQGGMGTVYLAEQISLKRKVALKMLRADLAANKTALARFEAEAHAVAQATHANIVQVYAFDQIDGTHFMALEYVEGRNLRQFLEKKGPPDVVAALSIIRQVAAALQRASELGIIHRDIKPENILLTRKGEVKVADFGLSRIFGEDRQPLNLTQSGVTMGTPLYMSPEQVEGKPVDPRTDIYSFGVTAYHLLAGVPPFRGSNAFEVAIQHVQGQAVPLAKIRPDLPAEMCNLVDRMMAKKPDDRIQTGREIVREVVRIRDSLVGAATVRGQSGAGALVQTGPIGPNAAFDATLTQSLPRVTAHSWTPWLILATVLVGIGAGLGFGWWRAGSVGDRSPLPDSQQTDRIQQPDRDKQSDAGEHLPPSGPPAMPKEEKRLLDHLAAVAGDDALVGKCQLDLALYYLKEHRLVDAEKAFKPLEDFAAPAKQGQPGQLQLLKQYGLLGKAIVLALQDNPTASNNLFKQTLTPKKKAKDNDALPAALKNRRDLAEWVAKALNCNYVNSPSTFPAGLQIYRMPPAAKLKSLEKAE